MLRHGDLSWIVPNKIIAFSSPQDSRYARNTRVLNPVSSEDLINEFIDKKVKGIIRLNDKLYDASVYKRYSIKVHEMEFPDGTCPEDNIIRDFISLTEDYIRRR